MPKAWSDVAGSDAFKALPAPERSAARDQYFEQVVQPQLQSPQDVQAARTQFMEASAPDVAEAPKRKSFTLGVVEGGGKVLGNLLGGRGGDVPGEIIPSPGSLINRGRKALMESEATLGVVPSGLGVFTGETAATLPAAIGLGPVGGGALVGAMTSDAKTPFGQIADTGIGAAGGKLIDLGIGGLKKGVQAIAKKVPDSVKQKAGEYVQGLMDRSKKTIADIEAFGTKAGDKPVLGAEAIGRPGKTALKVAGRREGATPQALEDKLTARKEDAPGRILTDFADQFGISPDAAKGDIESIVRTGKEETRPLYRRANEGGSIAPLEAQIQQSWTDLGRLERQAQDRVEDANREILLARAQASRAGNNVYGASGASEAGKAANDKLQGALSDLKTIEEDKGALEGFMRQAQEDIASGKKGGIWNPRIQRILNDPISKAGMRRGLEEERLEALREYKTFDPYEWAIKGYDAEGNPIVGRVPNMKLLNAVKKGLDAIINDSKDEFGRIKWDNRLYQIDGIRRNLVGELRAANPDYAVALDRSGDYISVSQAFDRGQKMILNGNVTEKQFADFIEDMTPGELQAARGGIANALFNKAQNGQLRPSQLLVPRVKAKLDTIFGDGRATEFINRLSIEQEMAQSGARMKPGVGSDTSETMIGADEQDSAAMKAGLDAGYALHHLSSGNWLAAITRGAMALNRFGIGLSKVSRSDVEFRDEVGRLLMLSPKELAAEVRALPKTDYTPAIKKTLETMEKARKMSGTVGGDVTSAVTNTARPPAQ